MERTGHIDRLHGLPREMLTPLLVGVFFTFAPIGGILVMIGIPQQGWFSGLLAMIISGFIGLGWCYTFLAKKYWLLAIVVPFSSLGHVGLFFGLSRLPFGKQLLLLGMDLHPSVRLAIIAAMAIAALAVGYSFTIRVTRAWERSHAQFRAELDVAARVHESIVPPVSIQTGTYEIFGRSDPCSEMGGDLIDVVRSGDVTDVYVVDVSGHGVGAGIVMGMIKSALRMRLRSTGALDHVLTDLNIVVCDLTRPEMFATLACLRLQEGGETEFALAGHLPILLGRGGEVHQLPNSHLPLGLMADERLSCGRLTLEPGDTLALFTDGFIEVMDEAGDQFGLERFVESFRQACQEPLASLHERLVAPARAHGRQIDDQSIVLVRRRA